MPPLEVREQNRLSLGRCLDLVLSGVQYRLFRASITVAIVALAVAFLMTMLSESLVGRRVAASVRARTEPRRIFLFWVDRLATPLTPAELARALTARDPDPARTDELIAWGGLSAAELETLRAVARREGAFLRFFAGLGEGHLRPLVGRERGRAIFRRLLTPENWESFSAALPAVGRQMPEPMEEFRGFLDIWRDTQALRARVIAGHERARKATDAMFGGQTATEALATAADDLPDRLRPLGFRMSASDFGVTREQARLEQDTRTLEAVLSIPLVKQRLALRRNIDRVAQVNATVLFDETASRDGAGWIAGLMKELDRPLPFDADRVADVARASVERAHLVRVESALPEETRHEEGFGFSSRVLWLIAVSLLVCVVGIANAMLMSVTERFREIATMKCLGATDGFIMLNFILESCIQGVAGGGVGVALGSVLGLLRAGADYGLLALAHVPVGEIALCAILSIAMGVAISALAAVYPAWIAARLAPLEAMRVE